MAQPTDQQLATEAAQRANEAVNQPRDPRETRSSIKAAAAAARAAIPAGAGQLNEPAIADAGTGVVPQPGAGRHEGERTPGTPNPNAEVPVQILTEEELAALDQGEGAETPPAPGGEPPPADGAEPAPAPEGGEPPPAEGAEEGGQPVEERETGWVPVSIPPRGQDGPPVEVEVEDPELAQDIQRLARGYIRREQLHAAMDEVNAAREDAAQLEDALAVDPVNYVIEHVASATKLDLARALLAQPEIFNRIIEEFGGLEGDALQHKALEIDNQRLQRRSTTVQELSRRSDIRQHGREIDAAIQRIIPEDMEERTAAALYRDLRRDVTDHLLTHKVRRLNLQQLPDILEQRLALYGLSADQAAERLQDTGFPPLPVAARTARANGAPARGTPRQPARTGEQIVAQAEARRRAAAVPGGGAGVPAQGGWALPQKQGVKARIAAIREVLGIGPKKGG